MNKLGLFWKVLLIMLTLSATCLASAFAWYMYDRRWGHNDYTEKFCRGLEKVYFHNGKVRVFNTQTNSYITPKLDWIANFDDSDSLTVFCYQGKRGYMGLYDGKIRIPAQYQSAWMFSEGLGAVIKDNKLGFINKLGKEAIPLQFPISPLSGTMIDYLFKQGLCTMINPSGKQGLINKKGEWVLQPEYEYIRNPINGYRVIKKNGKFGLLDSILNLKLPIKYDAINVANDGLVVASDGLQQKLAFDAKTVIDPFVYDEIDYLHFNSGKVDAEGEEILIKSDYLTYKVADKWGVMDKMGKVVIYARYCNINALTNDLFSCQIGDYWINLNAKGQIIY